MHFFFLINNVNKKEGPWALGRSPENALYKGIGEHSSFQSPAVNFDSSVASLRINMGYDDKFNRI